MTLVAAWLSMELNTTPAIWCVADTKVSNGEDTLSLETGKVLELPLVCTFGNFPYKKIYFERSIGFSYAGSTLTALNVYTILNTIFSHLRGDRRLNQLPDYKSILKKAKDVLTEFTISPESTSEICLFGFCPKTDEPFICKIYPEMKDSAFNYRYEGFEGYNTELRFILLGDHKIEIANLIKDKMSIPTENYKYWRTPVKVLQDVIKNKTYTSIDGGIQLAMVELHKFQQYFIVDKDKMHLRNIDLNHFMGDVGECFIDLPGMDINF